MQLSEVKQVKQVIGESNVNAKLKEGWMLLAVVPAQLPNSGSSALYILGKSEPGESKGDLASSSTLDGFTRDQIKAAVEGAQGSVLRPVE